MGGWLSAVLALLVFGWSGSSRAQVMELDGGGGIKVYDGPAVYSDQGVAPIALPPSKLARPRPTGAGPARAADAAALSRAADEVALSPDLVSAIAWRESGFRSGVVSRAGAVGEMQLMPATARALGVDPRDAGQNIRGGAAYLRGLMKLYDGDLVRSLAAYNAGPGAVSRYGGVPPFKETQAYVAAIMERLSQAALGAGVSGTTK